MYTKIDEATELLRKTIRIVPDIVLVLNTGLNNLPFEMSVSTEIPFDDVPGFVSSKNKKNEGKLIYGIIEDKYVLIMTGFPHCYEGFDNDTMAFPYRVFANLGIKNVLFSTACGAINKEFKVGDHILFKDHISLFAPNYLVGEDYSRFGPRLIDTSNIYNANLRSKILEGFKAKPSLPQLKEGIYCFHTGPNYETVAEVNALATLGSDMVGMAVVPDALLCHQLGMNVIGLALITNMAAGRNSRPLNYREVILGVRVNAAKQKTIIKQIVKLLPKE